MSLGDSFAGYRNGMPGKIHHAMEDGTPFRIFDSGVDVGDVDGDFPPPECLGIGTPYPVGFTMDELAGDYWRIKVWKFTTDSLRLEVPSLSIDYTFADEDTLCPTESAGGSEADLCRSYADGETLREYGELLNPAEDLTICPSFFTGVIYAAPPGYDTDAHEVRYFDGLYYPHLQLEIITYPVGVVDFGFAIHTHWYDGAWQAPQGLTATFLGQTISAFAGGDSGYQIWTGGLDITADEWWGYGGKFDTATGARL